MIIFSLPVLSNEGGGHGAPAQGGAKPVENKNAEWVELNSSVQTVRTKVKMKEELIQKLIEEKSKTKDPGEAAKIVKQMVSEHKELQKAIADYEEKRNLLKYRFPEAGLTKEREYERIEGKSLEAMENQWSLKSRIKASVKNIKSKYGIKSEDEQKKLHPTNSNPDAAAKESNPLADPMVISK